MKRNLLTWIFAACFTWIIFIFPSIPIQIRYISIGGFIGLFYLGQLKNFTPMKVTVLFFSYVILTGVINWFFDRQNDFAQVFEPVRLVLASVLVSAFVLNATLRVIIVFNTCWLGAELFGLAHDMLIGPIWRRIPFPIFSSGDLDMIGERHLLSDRFGGFTFEPGVLAGMTAIFTLINLAILYLVITNKKFKLGSVWTLITGLGIVLGLAILFLAKTKSGLATMVISIVSVFFYSIASRIGAGGRQRALAIVLACLLTAALYFGYQSVQNRSLGGYFADEEQNFLLLLDQGFNYNQGGGLNTRIQYAFVAGYGIFYHPFGVGYTNGYIWYQPVEKYITPTPEMDEMFAAGNYMGYKGYVFNLMMRGGFIALIATFLMLRELHKVYHHRLAPEMKILGFTLVVAFLILGVSVELLPYWHMLLFTIGVGHILRRTLDELEQHGRLAPGQFRQPLFFAPVGPAQAKRRFKVRH